MARGSGQLTITDINDPWIKLAYSILHYAYYDAYSKYGSAQDRCSANLFIQQQGEFFTSVINDYIKRNRVNKGVGKIC